MFLKTTVQLFFKKAMYTFIQQGCIKLIKSEAAQLFNIDNKCFLNTKGAQNDFWKIMWYSRLE